MKDEIERNQGTHGDESRAWFECDDGWGPLIADLESKLKVLSPDYTISQVKENFGGLRYYANVGDVDAETSKRFYDLIHEAESKSFEVCECCGQPGQLSRRGKHCWYKTLCSTCAERMNFEPVREAGTATP